MSVPIAVHSRYRILLFSRKRISPVIRTRQIFFSTRTRRTDDHFYMSRWNAIRKRRRKGRSGSRTFGKLYQVCLDTYALFFDRGMGLTVWLEQTGIAARVHDEFNCLPVENEEFRRIAEERALETLKPRKELKFIEKVPGKMMQPKTVAAADKSTFIVSLKSHQCFFFFFTKNPSLTANSKLQNPRKCAHKRTRRPVCHKTSFWISFLRVSDDTNIGLLSLLKLN